MWNADEMWALARLRQTVRRRIMRGRQRRRAMVVRCDSDRFLLADIGRMRARVSRPQNLKSCKARRWSAMMARAILVIRPGEFSRCDDRAFSSGVRTGTKK